jgi:hypothetical protein
VQDRATLFKCVLQVLVYAGIRVLDEGWKRGRPCSARNDSATNGVISTSVELDSKTSICKKIYEFADQTASRVFDSRLTKFYEDTKGVVGLEKLEKSEASRLFLIYFLKPCGVTRRPLDDVEVASCL